MFRKLPTEGIILNGGGKYPSNDLIKNSLDCSNLKELGDLVPRLYWNSSKAGLIKYLWVELEESNNRRHDLINTTVELNVLVEPPL